MDEALDEAGLEAYLGLMHHGVLSASVLARTLGELGPLSRIWQLSRERLREAGFSEAQIAALTARKPAPHCRGRVQSDLAWAAADDRAILHFESPRYPALLREIAAPPPVIFVEGRLECLDLPAIAMVGSRRGSAYGRRHAEWLARELSEAGLVICSGMALGIDTAAHKGALDAGGYTTAVMGTGVDVCYPARNRELREQIRAQGALVSEFPLGEPAIPKNFPRRNRIISGLAAGVVVIEASLKSGSLVTAKLALQQNREIFAMPGPISSSFSRGCHQLIRQGATLVETPEDILREMQDIIPLDSFRPKPASTPTDKSAPNPDDAKLLALIEESGTLPETLPSQAGLTQQQLNVKLLQLELAGTVVHQGGRYFPT
ncbi:MAG: DNA-protecting protein DprA [Gammaproteobacteria bacterium]|nr:DNA-protecting protein DprA [Gammaproteobacteria bacterium]MYH46667.1 DNA-protecting protein DprA [Gammaproteobacteria bacterium]MYL13588.1 DNA-protecting protein DprA [Gammaproteobacteria bacterium]